MTNEKKEKLLAQIKEWGQILLIALLIGFCTNTLLKPTAVAGESMMPTLADEDRLLLNRIEVWTNKVDRGDVVVFNAEGLNKILIKRVIGLPGDNVKVSKAGVFVNGEKLNEEAYIGNVTTPGDIEVDVKEGEYFVLGDNRHNSHDSRYPAVGNVAHDTILGTDLVRIKPFLEKIER